LGSDVVICEEVLAVDDSKLPRSVRVFADLHSLTKDFYERLDPLVKKDADCVVVGAVAGGVLLDVAAVPFLAPAAAVGACVVDSAGRAGLGWLNGKSRQQDLLQFLLVLKQLQALGVRCQEGEEIMRLEGKDRVERTKKQWPELFDPAMMRSAVQIMRELRDLTGRLG
jgi:hypothetical protein